MVKDTKQKDTDSVDYSLEKILCNDVKILYSGEAQGALHEITFGTQRAVTELAEHIAKVKTMGTGNEKYIITKEDIIEAYATLINNKYDIISREK